MAIAGKSFLNSKTIALNSIGLLVILLQVILGSQLIVDPEWQALVLAVLNIAIRFRTNSPIYLRK